MPRHVPARQRSSVAGRDSAVGSLACKSVISGINSIYMELSDALIMKTRRAANYHIQNRVESERYLSQESIVLFLHIRVA